MSEHSVIVRLSVTADSPEEAERIVKERAKLKWPPVTYTEVEYSHEVSGAPEPDQAIWYCFCVMHNGGWPNRPEYTHCMNCGDLRPGASCNCADCMLRATNA